MEKFSYSQIEQYLDTFFGSSSIGTLIGTVSLIYAFYLYQKSKKKHRLMIMTMSNGQREETRKTEIVIYNDGVKDITKKMFFNSNRLSLKFRKNLIITDIKITYKPDKMNKYKLKEMKDNVFQIKFDIIKKNQAIVLKLFHNSNKHIDDIWNDLQVNGTIADVEMLRDDFSDQLIRRAHSVDIPIYLATFLSTILLTYIFRLFIKPFPFEISITYLLVISLIISLLIFSRWFLNLVGDREYKIFWKFLEKSRNT